MHTSEEVLGYDGRTILEEKIRAECDSDDICKKMRDMATVDFEKIEKDASKIFAKEEQSARESVEMLSKLSKDLGALTGSLIAKATLGGVNKVIQMNEGLQNLLDKSPLDDKTKEEIKQSANDAAKDGTKDGTKDGKVDPKKFENAVESKIKEKQATKETVAEKIGKKKAAFSKGIKKVKAGVKKYGSPGSVAKASRAAASGTRALSKFLTAEKDDGSIDATKIVGGVLDVVDTLATFAPPPLSIITGMQLIDS